jgi:hypothetical protein
MIPYDDGFLIQQVSNSAQAQTFNSIGWFLLAGMDAG